MIMDCDLNKDFIRKYTRRKKGHDYYAPCHYHIIMRKAENCPYYGQVTGDAFKEPNEPGAARIDLTKLGRIISGNIFSLDKKHDSLKTYCYKVMPDHVHIFIRVKEKTNKHLGDYMALLKHYIAEEYSSYNKREISHLEIFEENYTDKIVFVKRNFNTIYNYIERNPQRLALRFKLPMFFERRSNLRINGEEFETYGYQSILGNPFKELVVVHRNSTDSEFETLKDNWLEHTAAGGVLVSPFYAQKEKRIRDMALEMGGKVIRLQKDPFPEKYKPGESELKYCARGQLLIIAPKASNRKDFNRENCLAMNDLSRALIKEEFSEPSSHTA